MAANIDVFAEEPNVTYTYEAKNLYKESFKMLHEFYQNSQLCDVEIKVGEKAVKCHRVVLACVSRYALFIQLIAVTMIYYLPSINNTLLSFCRNVAVVYTIVDCQKI